jgi:hypothetical protein
MGDEPGIGPAESGAQTATLSTICACGHKRNDHYGLRIEAKGSCLECECREFRPPRAAQEPADQVEKIRVALDQIEGAQAIVSRLRAQLVAGDPHQLKRGRALRWYLLARFARS